VRKVWYNPAFQRYNERKVEMARSRSANERLSKIVLFGQPSRAKRKAGRLRLGWEDVIKTDLREMVTSWEGVKKEALNRLGRRRNLHSCVGIACKK
jgi:hypothetical protein